MKFKDIKYKRPDFDKLINNINQHNDKLKNAKTKEEYFQTHKEIEDLFKGYYENFVLAEIRNTIDTKDEFYDKEMQVFFEIDPSFDELYHNLKMIRLQSPFRKDFEEKYGTVISQRDELQKDIFDPSIKEDRVKEHKLADKYDKLTGGAKINFRGETKNIPQMVALTEEKDRETRKEAFESLNGWFNEHLEELDGIFDDLVKVRTKIANKLGFKTYTPVAYKMMGRIDWNQEDAKNYRKQIVEDVVPLTQKIYEQQKKRIGIEDFKYYDVPLSFLSGNPKPVGGEEVLVKAAEKMYNELSPETGEFFRAMVDDEMMDLTTKPNKAPGGYMTFLSETKMPFIFSNFNGTSGDADVLTHEAGHAFQGYVTRDMYPADNNDLTMEIAETHSMSMEFFTHPWMKDFFKDDTEKYYYYHVTDALKFIPYGASVDEFQEVVYENPDLTPEERRAKYREIEKKYLPHIDYDGNEYLESGGRWQRQSHIYNDPFYYIDYTIAQVNAFQYFIRDLKDHDEAWNSYLKLCELSATKTTKDLLKAVGLKSPFDDGTIREITPKLEAYLDSLDKEKIK